MRVLLLMLLACWPGADTELDTGKAGVDVPAPKTGEGCAHHLRVNGTPIEEMGNARIGETWYVLLWCDNILEQGPSVLQITPPSLATVDSSDPILTFASQGMGTIFMQVGTLAADAEVVVVE